MSPLQLSPRSRRSFSHLKPTRHAISQFKRNEARRTISIRQHDHGFVRFVCRRATVRARNLKPSLFKNELLAVSDPLHTVIFEGLWCLADREGRLEDKPTKIHLEINAGRAFEGTQNAIAWLEQNGFIERYQVADSNFIQVTKFKEHQNPHQKEAPSKIPEKPKASTRLSPVKHRKSTSQARLIPSSLTPDSGFPLPESPSLNPESLLLPSEAMSDAKPPDDVQRVFDHWAKVFNHPGSHLDVKRRALIRSALKGYSADDLCESLSGYQNSGHHMGINDRNTVYDGLHLLLRDADHIDAGLRFAREPPELSSKLTQHNVAVLQNWRPPESRDENPGYAEISSGDGDSECDIRQRVVTSNH